MRQLKHILIMFIISMAYLSIRPVFAHQAIENHGDSQLMMAAYDGNVSKMRQLLERGADINQTNKLGLTALYFAAGATRTQVAFKGSTEAVKFLLLHGATVNHKSNINGYTALMAACANQNAGSVALLLKYGEDVNALTKDGRSALSIAASLLEPEIVTLLLEHGAHVNGYADTNGQTPLLAAVAAAPRYTLSSPAKAMEIILQNASKLDNSLNVVKLLLSHHAETNIIDRNERTALTYAVSEENPLLVRPLLEHGANPNVSDKSHGNATPLILATKIRYVSIAEMLLKQGAVVSTKDQSGKSALDYAIERGPNRMIELLRQADTHK